MTVFHEIKKSGKPFTDGECIKNYILGIIEHLFSEFKNKTEIFAKTIDIPLSISNFRDRAVKMAKNVTQQQLYDLKS